MEIIAEYLADLGLDAAKQHTTERIDEKKLKAELTEHIESQRKYNDICSRAEECDFEGLMEYITKNLLHDVESRFFSGNLLERRDAHNEIISRAVRYSKANTDEAKKRVASIVATSLEVLRDFFKKKKAVADYILATEIVDAVNENTNTVVKSGMDELKCSLSDISGQVESLYHAVEKGSLYSAESLSAMIEGGKFNQVNKVFKKLFADMSVEHPLYPDYGYTYDGKRLKSTPLNVEAQRKYPIRYSLKGTVRAGVHYFNDLTEDPMDYAYRHQLRLVMSVREAVKLLGNEQDPIQTEAQELVGKELIATPPEFPKALPCSIKVGEKTFFDYILLRTQEILDDGTFILGNREQPDSNIYFEVRFNPSNPLKENFSININNANNCELLNYVKFMDELSRVKDLHIFALSQQKDFVAGTIMDVNYKTGFPSVEEEIDFLERVCIIENYFHVSLNITGQISEEEYRLTLRISDLVMNNEVQFTWSEASFTGCIGSEFRQHLNNWESLEITISYVAHSDVNLFGVSFEMSHMRTYKKAVMKDFEKVKQIVSLMDDGDPIKICFIPGQDDVAFDTLHIPDEMKALS